jgi:hypothetical protein
LRFVGAAIIQEMATFHTGKAVFTITNDAFEPVSQGPTLDASNPDYSVWITACCEHVYEMGVGQWGRGTELVVCQICAKAKG